MHKDTLPIYGYGPWYDSYMEGCQEELKSCRGNGVTATELLLEDGQEIQGDVDEWH